jgi:hypothetical protein
MGHQSYKVFGIYLDLGLLRSNVFSLMKLLQELIFFTEQYVLNYRLSLDKWSCTQLHPRFSAGLTRHISLLQALTNLTVKKYKMGTLAHACNPSYLGDGDRIMVRYEKPK